LSRSPTLAELEAQLHELQRAFMAEAERVDPRTATEEELRALDAKALPLQALSNQIRRLRPIAQLRNELAATRKLQHEAARSDAERELFRKNADEVESLLAERLQRRAALVRRVVVGVAGLVLLAAGAWFAWYL
jgi:dynactin complex subunit